MPRQLRIQYPGAMYHVVSRGNRRAARAGVLTIDIKKGSAKHGSSLG
jgi:hypothetical protein